MESKISHPEWNTENSLTSPEDRDRINKWKPVQNSPPLTIEETEIAVKELDNTSFTDKFPRIDRTYADPIIPMQYIGLISFVPAKGATPNENGVYGFAKLRGNYPSEIEASQQATHLIRNIDSHHQIYHTYVGRPFPITVSSDYSAKTDEIDIRKEMAKDISSNIRKNKDNEEKEINEIKQREEKLIEDSKKTEEDPYEEYITLRVKKAQLSWTYLEHIKKIEEIKNIIIKTRSQVEEYDEKFPDFKNTYYEKYMKARKDSGIKESKQEADSNFIKFLVEDVELPGIDDLKGGVQESKN
jgi:Family of unknown function (DUF5832)